MDELLKAINDAISMKGVFTKSTCDMVHWDKMLHKHMTTLYFSHNPDLAISYTIHCGVFDWQVTRKAAQQGQDAAFSHAIMQLHQG